MVLILRKKPLAPIEQEAGWVPQRVWMLWKRYKSLLCPKDRGQIIQPIV